jgi:hypothetical protein
MRSKGVSVVLSNKVQVPVSRRKRTQFIAWFDAYQTEN